MLTQLSIRNVVLIEKLDLSPCNGFMVLTGETGAGKSILLDALGLGLGARAEAGLVRQGADQASVSLTFELSPSHPAFTLMHELGLEADKGADIILRRTLAKDGRSKAFINDEPVAVSALKKLAEILIEIHGQFETHGLLRRETHLSFLDAFAGLTTEAEKMNATYSAWQTAEKAFDAAKTMAEHAARQADDIRAGLEELRRLAPQQGEADALAEKRTNLQGREKIMEALQNAWQELQAENGAAKRMASARRILARASEKAATLLAPALDCLDAAENSLAEALQHIEALTGGGDYDPAQLDKIEERLFALRAAGRKYQCHVDELPALAARMEKESALIDGAGTELKALEKEAARARSVFEKDALSLHQARQASAKKLELAVAKELPPLKLERARFSIAVDELPLSSAGPQGISDVTFMAATNAGQPPAPLHKIASGGELARFMLALRLCLSQDSAMSTLVFDEVDSGIGGATASAVGERLALLGTRLQTLAVTHSPQVAACATQHWHIEKHTRSNQTTTKATLLEGEERREEIARMLSGSTVTNAAREAAASLLDNNKNARFRRKAS